MRDRERVVPRDLWLVVCTCQGIGATPSPYRSMQVKTSTVCRPMQALDSSSHQRLVCQQNQ